MFEFIALGIVRREIEQAEDNRLRSLPKDQQDFELRLREVKAQEKLAVKNTVVNVKSSIF